jgi:hypothetical protein
MDSNTSTPAGLGAGPGATPAGLERLPARLVGLAAAVAELAADDPAEFGDGQVAAEFQALRRLADQLDGVCLRHLATVDARGAAGAEHGVRAESTAGWLRATLRMSPATAARQVRTARALYRGPLAVTAQALAAGEVSVEHATVLADTTHDLPPARVAEAEGVLVDAARRLDPGRLRRLTTHLREVIDPDAAENRARARLERRGCGCRPPTTAWSRWAACWTPRPARPSAPPWPLWPGPPAPTMPAAPPSGVRTGWGSWPGWGCRLAWCRKLAGCARR